MEDEDIINALEKLKFDKVSKFNLIEEDYPTISIFIEIDERAERIRKQIQKILQQEKGFERRNELLKLKKALNKYSLSIRCNEERLDKITTLPPLFNKKEEKWAFRYIPRNQVEKWYDKESGFDPPESTFDMRAI